MQVLWEGARRKAGAVCVSPPPPPLDSGLQRNKQSLSHTAAWTAAPSPRLPQPLIQEAHLSRRLPLIHLVKRGISILFFQPTTCKRWKETTQESTSFPMPLSEPRLPPGELQAMSVGCLQVSPLGSAHPQTCFASLWGASEQAGVPSCGQEHQEDPLMPLARCAWTGGFLWLGRAARPDPVCAPVKRGRLHTLFSLSLQCAPHTICMKLAVWLKDGADRTVQQALNHLGAGRLHPRNRPPPGSAASPAPCASTHWPG